MKHEDLTKSIDQLIDEVFEDTLEKACDPALKGDKTADEAVKNAPKGQKDQARNAGRPKQISDVPEVDEDGKREKEYDDAISAKQENTDPAEANAKLPSQMKKSISRSEYEEFLAYKAYKEEQEALKKSQHERQAQKDLIKAATAEVVEELRKSMEDLKKANEEQALIIKSISRTPVRSHKAITTVEQLEKSEIPGESQPEFFSKSQMLDAAEELVKSQKLSASHLIELDSTGYINDPEARKAIEQELTRKK